MMFQFRHVLNILNGFNSCLIKITKVICGIRVKRNARYKFLPILYTKYPLRLGKLFGAIAFFLLAGVICIPIFLHFYIFEADIKLIYLDNMDDYLREIDAGTASIDVSGWKYMNKFEPESLIGASRRGAKIEPDKSFTGYWIWKQNEGKSSKNSITLSDFQFWKRHQVTLALRYYIHGVGKVSIDFENVYGEVHSMFIIQDNNQQDGSNNFKHLCTQFILTPFEGFVQKIRISGTTSSGSSFIVIDKILVAVGNDNRGLHMLFTLLPKDWCSRGNSAIISERP